MPACFPRIAIQEISDKPGDIFSPYLSVSEGGSLTGNIFSRAALTLPMNFERSAMRALINASYSWVIIWRIGKPKILMWRDRQICHCYWNEGGSKFTDNIAAYWKIKWTALVARPT